MRSPCLPSSHEQAPCRDPLAVREQNPESGWATPHKLCDGAAADLAPVALYLVPSDVQEVAGRHAVARQEPVHVYGGGVARRPGVHHENLAASPGKDQRRGQPGGTAANYHYVAIAHDVMIDSAVGRSTTNVAVSGKSSSPSTSQPAQVDGRATGRIVLIPEAGG